VKKLKYLSLAFRRNSPAKGSIKMQAFTLIDASAPANWSANR
jgi:hypothetical protein